MPLVYLNSNAYILTKDLSDSYISFVTKQNDFKYQKIVINVGATGFPFLSGKKCFNTLNMKRKIYSLPTLQLFVIKLIWLHCEM